MKTILITGASGDVATHLRRELAGKYNLRLSDIRPLKPVKGELLLIEIAGRPFDCDVTCENDGIYHFRDNRYWLGGTREDAGFDYSVSDAGARKIMAKAEELIPGISRNTIIQHGAALRPATPDGLPLVGRVASHRNLSVATGAGSKGMLWSVRMAGVIVAELCGETDDAAAAVAPERFAV